MERKKKDDKPHLINMYFSHSQSVYYCEKQRRATPVEDAWMDYVSDNLIEKKHHLFFSI